MGALTKAFLISRPQQHRCHNVPVEAIRTTTHQQRLGNLILLGMSSVSEEEEEGDVGDDADTAAADIVSSKTESAATEWQLEQNKLQPEKEEEQQVSSNDEQQQEQEKPPSIKIAVVGGGWGGWGAAKAICESNENVEVTL